MDDTMYRGATIWARKTVDSEIFIEKPDKWFKIWFFLISKVNHKDNGKFKRGEGLVRYAQIQDACGATKSQVDHSIRWFKREGMLATRKATRGMFITVINYDTYQNLDNYKSDTKSDLKATPTRHKSDTINKNVKNANNVKKKSSRFAPPSPIEVNSYAKEIGFNLDGNSFCDFYAAKGWKVGKTPMKDWKAAIRTWKSRHAADNPPEKKRTNTCHTTDCDRNWEGTFESRQYCKPCLKELRGY